MSTKIEKQALITARVTGTPNLIESERELWNELLNEGYPADVYDNSSLQIHTTRVSASYTYEVKLRKINGVIHVWGKMANLTGSVAGNQTFFTWKPTSIYLPTSALYQCKGVYSNYSANIQLSSAGLYLSGTIGAGGEYIFNFALQSNL